MKSYLFEYFRFTRAERNGMLLLAFLCFSLIIFYHCQEFIFKEDLSSLEQYEDIYCSLFEEIPQFEKEEIRYFNFDPNIASKEKLMLLGISAKASQTLINYRKAGGKIKSPEDLLNVYGFNKATFEKLQPYIKIGSKKEIEKASYAHKKKKERATELFSFDPNVCSEADLMKLGLSQKVVNTIINYRSKVAFKTADDFKKIYGLKEQQFNQLLPYLNIPEHNKEETFAAAKPENAFREKSIYGYQKREKVIIDINGADENEWQKLSGIGPTFSKRIVKFRSKLGGFHSIDQVAETYGMTDSTFQIIKPYLKNEVGINKIRINEVELEELRAHPYIKWKHAKVLINYRKHHGAYEGIEDLKKVKVLSEDLISQLSPYLSFE